MAHKISIIIPVYNTASQLLDQAIKSCEKQTFEDIEIVIVDDGSTDEATLKYLADIEKQQPEGKIKIAHIPNGGVSNARMQGVKLASGKYVTFLDSDDVLSPIFCECLYTIITQTGSDMAGCGNFRFRDISECDFTGNIPSYYANIEEVNGKSESPVCTYKKSEYLLGGILGATDAPAFYTLWAKLLLREKVLDNCRVYSDIARGEDMLAVFEYLTACDRIAVIKDKLYFYNEGNDDSVTKKSNPRQMTVALAWIEMYDICCNKGYDSLREKAAVKAVMGLIDAISGAGRNKGASQVGFYADKIGRFHSYFKLLSRSNRIKAVIIMRVPFIYTLMARIRSK